MIQKKLYYLVNGITSYRLIMAPVLIVLVVYGREDIFRWLLPVSFFTDILDGYFARKFQVASIFGAKLDSIADDFTIIAAITGMFIFKWAFLKQEFLMFISIFAVFIFQIILALFRYRRISSFHTYGAKIAFLAQGIFIILLFFLPNPVMALFYIAWGITMLELIEEIIITFLLPEWESNVKGLYWIWKRNKK